MTHPSRSIVVHGHFYQPPREDPWTGVIPLQPSAAPYHDWNERIERECYGPVVELRVPRDGRPDAVVNALEWMSFDYGPTLLVWLERHAPETYHAVVEADGASADRLDGHGNAMAMPYHHPILPLSTERDRLTEIRWGIADFRVRFGRDPEGMWLPETAVDDETLEALAGEGISFTVLAPHQVEPVPERGRPGRYRTAGGRDIALFVYDGTLAHGVAFGDLLEDGRAWAELMVGDAEAPDLRSLATDGETFGHHHRWGAKGLAEAIVALRSHPEVRVESYASFLAREGTTESVDLVAPTSWSCAHGIERWRADCGCKMDPSTDTQQAWREPLRGALEWLAAGLHDVFERDGAVFFDDPWAARDAYGEVVARTGGKEGSGASDRVEATVMESLPREAAEALGSADGSSLTGRAVELLEMERNALRLFTSCAWFFDDVGGLEPRQVLAYAARAIELAGVGGPRLRQGFLERLSRARSNDPEVGTAADLFEEIARTRRVAPRGTRGPVPAEARKETPVR